MDSVKLKWIAGAVLAVVLFGPASYVVAQNAPLIIQQGGSFVGAAAFLNFSAGVTCTSTGGTVSCGTSGQIDLPGFQICITAGCGSEVTATRYPIKTVAGITLTDCSINLAIPPTGSSVIIDVQTASGTSIFGTTKLVFPTTGTSTTVVHQTTFAGGIMPLALDTLLKVVVTQNDSNGVAQFGYVGCH